MKAMERGWVSTFHCSDEGRNSDVGHKWYSDSVRFIRYILSPNIAAASLVLNG